MDNFQLFDTDVDQEKAGGFKFCSPEKKQRKLKNLADPLYKPFGGDSIDGLGCDSDDESLYSSFSESRSLKSEDDSPIRRKMMRSPTKKMSKQKR